MYKVSYAEIMDGSATVNRAREGEALDYVVTKLTNAETAGLESNEMRAALTGLQDLWGFFIGDLASKDNALPEKLRADLAAIGLWVIERADDILNSRSRDLASLIDVNRTVRVGLQ